MTQRFRMVVAYDGTAYRGWQVQPGHRTIQGEIERVVREVTQEEQRVHCSGRTDTGVHAKAQVAHFDLERKITPGKLLAGVNALLDPDIRALSLRRVSPEFHARYSAKGKEYRYFIWNGPVLQPFLRNYRTHVKAALSIEHMAAAAAKLTGEHDFAAFSANPKRDINGTVRDLRELDVTRRGHEVVIVAKGNGFLYKMVRSLAGFLIRVGTGELQPQDAEGILESKTRTARVPTAPPQGLFLWRVEY